jgi:DNA-binding NarL/FixJ family response regulator
MTFASAASTMGDTWNQRLPRAEQALESQSSPRGSLPPAWAPVPLAAADLPRGKVLVVADEAMMALELQQMLREAGFRVIGPAAVLADIQRLIERGRLDCAIVDLDAERRLPLPASDVLALAEVPFVMLTSGPRRNIPQRHSHRPVVERPVDRTKLIAAVQRAMGRRRILANDNRWQSLALVRPTSRLYPAL